MEYKVNDYPDLVKVDKSYVINTNENQYKEALRRRKMVNSQDTIEKRLSSLENTMTSILEILKERL